MFKFRALVRDRDGGAMGGSVLLSQIKELIGSLNASSSDESSSSEEEEKDSFCVYITITNF